MTSPTLVSSSVSVATENNSEFRSAGANNTGIDQKHWDEWTLGSGVSPEITIKNISSLYDPNEVKQILNRNVTRKWKQPEELCPGWVVRGLHPDGWEPTTLSAEYKPNETLPDKNGKFRKYLRPSDSGAYPLFLDWGEGNWEKVKQDVSIPLGAGEGAKKAGAMLSQGDAAISLPGVTTCRKHDVIHPWLEPFVTPGRKIYLFFDGDWRTNKNVHRALVTWGGLFRGRGAIPYVLMLPPETKGIDDFIVQYGAEAYRELVESAPTFKAWFEEYGDMHRTEKFIYQVSTTVEDTVYKATFEEGQGKWRTFNGIYHRFNSLKGYWENQTRESVSKLISQELRKCFELRESAKGKITEIRKFFTHRNSRSTFNICAESLAVPDIVTNDHLIAFRNGTYNIKTKELQPHNPLDYLTWGIDADYTPQSDCPEIFAGFIYQTFGAEYLELIRAILSMYLDPAAPYGYFVHIKGESGTGKGTFIRFLTSCFQKNTTRSISHFSLLQTAEALHQHLTGVRLCVCPDAKNFQGKMTNFYELVDNGSLGGRALYQTEGYQKTWNVRFALASTQWLSIENSGDGWDRRCIPVETKPREGEMDLTLGSRLQSVKPQVISWALSMDVERRDALLKSACKMEAIANLKREQATFADSTKSFIDSCLMPKPDAKPLTDAEIYEAYKAYCAFSSHKPKSLGTFRRDLGTNIRNHKREGKVEKVNGKAKRRPTQWVDLELHPDLFDGAGNLASRNLVEGGLEAFEDFKNNPVTWLHEKSDGYMKQQELHVTAETPLQSELQPPVTWLHEEVPKVDLSKKNNDLVLNDDSPPENKNNDVIQKNILGSSPCNHVTAPEEESCNPCTEQDTAVEERLHETKSTSCNQGETSCNHVTEPHIASTLEQGSRIKFYPTADHAENGWEVRGVVQQAGELPIVEHGIFAGCDVVYWDYKTKEERTVFIAGGLRDWIVRKL